MYSHTLILETTKLELPNNIGVEFVTKLINSGLVTVEYFGIEVDNQADYESDEMINASKEKTYIEINFDTDHEINYNALSENERIEFVSNVLKYSEKPDFRTDGKDLTINI